MPARSRKVARRHGAGHLFDSAGLRDAGAGCATANLTTTLLRTTLARFVIGRPRPGQHRGPYRFELFTSNDWDHRSFPSGHAFNIMSCAAFFNRRFDLGAAGPILWVATAAIGAGRMLDDAHWMSDTVAGLTLGHAVGRTVADRHLARAADRAAERSLRPGITLVWRITF